MIQFLYIPCHVLNERPRISLQNSDLQLLLFMVSEPMTENEEKLKPETMKTTPSPYELNSNDNPRNVITEVQLKAGNYEEWARAIRTSLRAR